MTRDEAVKLCDRYHRAIYAIRTFSSVGDGPTRPSEGMKEAQAAEDAIVAALTTDADALIESVEATLEKAGWFPHAIGSVTKGLEAWKALRGKVDK
jgi:hypothetical protein